MNKDVTTIQVGKQTQKKISRYCRRSGLIMRHFVETTLLSAIQQPTTTNEEWTDQQQYENTTTPDALPPDNSQRSESVQHDL